MGAYYGTNGDDDSTVLSPTTTAPGPVPEPIVGPLSGAELARVRTRDGTGTKFEWMDGGAGNDYLRSDNHTWMASYFPVNIFGGTGNDTLVLISNGYAYGGFSGGDGNDYIVGSTVTRTELFYGGNDDDIVRGSDISTSADPDLIYGEGGRDALYGLGGNDYLDGGAGDDGFGILTAGSPGRTAAFSLGLFGGDGNDTLDGGTGADVLNGGDGVDLAMYNLSAAGVWVDLTQGIGLGGDAQGDALFEIENVTGSNFDDTITGSSAANDLKGRGGINKLYGLAGNDTLTGGADNDTLDGGADRDIASFAGLTYGILSIDLASSSPIVLPLTAGVGSDTLISIEGLIGGNGTSWFWGTDASNFLSGDGELYGRAGHDTLVGNGLLEGGDGDDILTGSGRLNGGNGDDQITAGGSDSVDGGDGNDRITFAAAETGLPGLIRAGSGNDTITLSANPDALLPPVIEESPLGGFDTIRYQVGANSFPQTTLFLPTNVEVGVSSGGMEHIIGNAGHNWLYGDFLSIIAGGGGDDALFGEEGVERVDFGVVEMYGGQGRDTFVFNTKPGHSAAKDFESGVDRVVIHKQLLGLSGTGTLAQLGVLFRVADPNNSATPIIEQPTLYFWSGVLYWDPTGLRDNLTFMAQVLQISGQPATLTAADIEIGGNVNPSAGGVFTITNAGQTIAATSLFGTETIQASVHYALPEFSFLQRAEHLQLTGTAHLYGWGNAADNSLTGNSGNNVLEAVGGNDTIVGGAGNDTLAGGSGTNALTGAGGWDVASYSVASTAATVVRNANGTWTISGAGFSDTLSGVEIARFSDRSIALRERSGGDLDGEGTSDLVLQNGGTVVDWIMQNGTYQSGNVITTGAVGFTVIGKGDLDADGDADLLLQKDGTIVSWNMQAGAYQSGTVITTGATGFTVVGTGDFDVDGDADVLLQKDGTVVAWTMQGGAYQSGSVITGGATGYTVVGTGDFDADGDADVLLQKDATVVAWRMQNGAYQSGSVITTGAVGYQVVGTGDFDGDGDADIALQSGGIVVVWRMQNTTYESGIVLSTSAGDFQVAEVGDYNDDGTSDLVLQSGGTVMDWILRNGQIQASNVISTNASGFTVV